VLLALLSVPLLAGVARAHSELVSSTPADGAVLAAPPTEISGDFSEAVDPGRSTMELRGPGGAQIAVGKVPDGGEPTRIVIDGLPDLAPGAYEVRWTTVTPTQRRRARDVRLHDAAATPTRPHRAHGRPDGRFEHAPEAAPSPRPRVRRPTPGGSSTTGAGDLLIPLIVWRGPCRGGAWGLPVDEP